MKRETMSRRDRVLAAICHQQPDRMPIDLGVHFSTGISVFAYQNLRKHLGLSIDNIAIAEVVQMLARVDDDIRARFHCDTMLLNPPWRNPIRWTVRDDFSFWLCNKVLPQQNEKGEWIVSRGNEFMRMPPNGYFFDGAWLSAHDADSDAEEMELFGQAAERIYKETDYFTLMMGFSAYFNGIEFGCTMLTDPETAIAQQEADLRQNLARIEQVIRTFGPYIQAIEINSDLGSQNAPFVRPSLYEKFCLPYLKEFTSFVHRNSDIKIFLHSCGSIEPLIPYIIEGGVDILNPVQISAQNMEPERLKRLYGDRICFWGGGCDTQNILPHATPEQIRQHVAETTRIFKPGGGFVFNQVHNIMGDVPPENVVAMFDAAYENAFYD